MTLNKTTKILSFAILMFAMIGMTGITSESALAVKPGNGAGGVGKNGYQLNLIGMNSGDKLTNDGTGNGHRIFIPLDGHTRILLTEGPFAVLDGDGTDGVAAFRLPAPEIDCPIEAEDDDPCFAEGNYTVHIRVLGKPGDGRFMMLTCQTQADGTELCSTDGAVDVTNANGPGKKAKFTNVTKKLLTVCLDFDLDGKCDARISLFDDGMEGFFWEVWNEGKRLVQLRFIWNND